MPDPSSREQEIFNGALELPGPRERAAYLDTACGSDAALRASVEALLRAYDEAGSFLHETAESPTQITVPLTEKPGDRIGRYKLLQKIGEGGCGVVYMAEQEQPVRRRVALKVIKLGMDTRSVIARFEAERQALAMMDHPNIAKVLDAGATESGRPFFVMELVRGFKITEYCDQNSLSTSERLKLFTQVCHAIQHAHQKGVIHRDIKPSNVLVTENDGVPVPKVIDFGKATNEQRLTDKTVFTAFEQFIGTPAYMSPEQAAMTSLDIDTRSDIYSLGVLLYELLTGRTPFDPSTLLQAGLDEMRRIIREQEPARPSTRLSTLADADLTDVAKHRHSDAPKLINLLRGDLDWIVMKALEKDRTRRYETANGLAMDIQRHLNSEPVTARPPSAAYRFQKLVRRNKLAFTTGAAVTMALVLGLAFSTWSFLRERVTRQRAVTAEHEQSRLRGEAEQERTRAQAGELSAQRNAYNATMLLAQVDWENNNIGHLRQLLAETEAYPQRGFEWYYWQRMCHLELTTVRGHLQGVTSIALSPDGQRIVSGSWDDTVKVWDANTGRELLTLRGHTHTVTSVAYSHDGELIVSGSWDQMVKVWEGTTGQELLSLKGDTRGISSVAFSPDGKRIVSGGYDNSAKVWDRATGDELLTLTGHTNAIGSVAFSPDGQRIVSASADGALKVWEAATGRELFTVKGHPVRGSPVAFSSVVFSADGQRIVSSGEDGQIRVREAATGHELLTFNGHINGGTAVAFSPDSTRIVSGGRDSVIKVWEAATGVELLTLKGHGDAVSSVAFCQDGRRIVSGSSDATVKIWEAGTKGAAPVIKAHATTVNSLAFSPDGKRLVSSGNQTVKVWDVTTGRDLLTITGRTSAAFSPDGRTVASGGRSVELWDTATRRDLLTFWGEHGSWVDSVAFDRDGRRIASAGGDSVRVWDPATGRELLSLKHPHVGTVSFSPDGQRIASGSAD